MRIAFGVLGLVLVLAIIGSLAKRQLQAVHVPAVAGASAPALSGTPAEQSRQLQDKVASDVNKLMKQAPERAGDAQ